MSRYIDADDALEVLNLMYDNQEDKDDPYNVGVMGAINYIKHRAPSVDICFCKNCVKHNTHRCHMAFDLVATEDDDFCSYGQKGDENVETD